MGSSAAVPAPFAATSGASTPSSSPLPKLVPFREKRLAISQPMKDAAMAPPGVTPIHIPTTQERSSESQ